MADKGAIKVPEDSNTNYIRKLSCVKSPNWNKDLQDLPIYIPRDLKDMYLVFTSLLKIYSLSFDSKEIG